MVYNLRRPSISQQNVIDIQGGRYVVFGSTSISMAALLTYTLVIFFRNVLLIQASFRTAPFS
jgi:hypothetical protein